MFRRVSAVSGNKPTRAEKNFLDTKSMKFVWNGIFFCTFRSHNGEIGMLLSRSLSPSCNQSPARTKQTWLKNSFMTRIAHFLAISNGFTTFEMSALFISTSIVNCPHQQPPPSGRPGCSPAASARRAGGRIPPFLLSTRRGATCPCRESHQ